jgi:hypothetical protein
MDQGIELEVVEVSQEEMQRLEEEARAMEEEKQKILEKLAGEIQGKFTERAGRRSMKEREWLESTRLYLGSLSLDRGTDDKEHPIAQTGRSNKPRHNLVRTKCSVAIAKSVSSQFAGGDKNWDINATPSSEGDQAHNQIAAKAMEREILDQQEEDNYGYKSRLAMQDRVILGTGILKGPLPARDQRLTYTQDSDPVTGEIVMIPEYKTVKRPVMYQVSPWMFFPDDTVNDIRDAEDTIELHPMSKLQLMKLKKNPGFFPDAIDELLKLDPESYANSAFSEYSSLTDSGVNFLKDKYTVLERHGPLSIDQLGSLGITPSTNCLGDDTYFGEVWVCQGVVIRLELEAIEGLYENPYCVCPWEKDPNSIFGFGLPQIIKDPQRIAQITLDMILENASMSSGPVGIINTAFMEPFDGDYTVRPGKMFRTTDYTLNSVDQAMKFLQVPNMSANLFPLLEFARSAAQEESAIPFFGVESPIASTDSATGLGMLQASESVVSDFKSEEWDDMMTERIIDRYFHWNMQYNAKPEIIGDFEIDVRSSTEFRNKQLAVKDLEKLSVEAAQNPAMAAVINQPALQRARLAMLRVTSDQIVKSPEQVAQEEEAAKQNPPPPDPAMLKYQSDMAATEVAKEKIALEREKMQFEMAFQQAREEMNHKERMGANYMRELEVQARVTESMAEREIELLKLAQKEDSDKAWIMAELSKSELQADAQKFQAGLDSQSKFRDQALTAAELKMKRETGSGI